MDPKASILKKLRVTASACPSAATRSALQDHANAISKTMELLAFTFTDERLRELNGLWARAYVMLDAAQKPATPTDPTGTQQPIERIAA
ncbi:hypothetical protein HU230_0012605 [Bradyrhizobium quebecense]|uniref:Uncharacterized protein n=1 Tax=Bradyrhizobium quebecense TaxID=2748629 RepID=A0A974AGR5_9BRAD|nr:hypothetical protein [Bradyrhizobium quebecense]UGA46830.1 hypothetical protein HU230_0012605 [Bradyrhizobium quebecense]